MEIQGTLHQVSDIVQVSDTFKKREFVVKYEENPLYPQFIKFELKQDSVREIDAYKPGEPIEVNFNLRGREWISPQNEKKYFNTLEAWRLSRPEGKTFVEEVQEGEPEDLPF